MSTEKLSRADFGLGILASLYLKGIHFLDEFWLNDLHAGFFEAFRVVEQQLGQGNVEFSIDLDGFQDTSDTVFRIFSNWDGPWATLIPNGTVPHVWQLEGMNEVMAEAMLANLPGGQELFSKATDALLERYGH